MEVRVLGSGSGLDASLGNTSFVLSHQGENILVDCGYTVFPKLLDLGIQDSIDTVFISHLHSDHVGSLCALLEYNCFAKGKKTRLCGVDLKPYVDLTNLTLWDACVNGAQVSGVELIETKHIPGASSVGALFFDKVFYSGDTGYSLLGSELANRAELIIHEAYLKDMPLSGKSDAYIHVGIETLAKSASAEVRAKTWITHYSKPSSEQLENMCKDLGFAGLAKPGQIFNL